MQSLWNKSEELSTLIRYDLDYQQTSLFCSTETWLSEDTNFDLEGFNIICFERDVAKMQNSIQGRTLHGCQWQEGNKLHYETD